MGVVKEYTVTNKLSPNDTFFILETSFENATEELLNQCGYYIKDNSIFSTNDDIKEYTFENIYLEGTANDELLVWLNTVLGFSLIESEFLYETT